MSNETGIDLSCDQAHIDWNIVAPQEHFVYIKVAEGIHTVDPMAKSHAEGAESCGYEMGYYYFAHPGRCDARASAQFFKTNLQGLPAPTLRYALDIEINEDNISPAAMLQWIHDFIAEFGLPIMIYGGPGFLDANLPDGHDLGQYPLWLAEYEGTAAPTVFPKGWTACSIWQHSGNGTVPGITEPVDLNLSNDLPLLPNA